ncbi:DUF2397 domain-containing protein [Planosporangium thailandense]|uniref:DUF2397 domain-containing protein n=1 Tax=Planosporangium thailandense TaxID=765197 RepID=A0ABX0Y3U0_9ACTN|nr:DUF2397 domain-containing protein [Planosporangium thailandense]NJC73018.1 DUF2397 domain-containing protein [Planosporangium thailandense]
MTDEEDEGTHGLAADVTVRDTSSQRALFSYLTADVADEYIAIMRLFTSTLLADLSAAEVAAQLAERGLTLDPDTVENRCQQLVDWGNLVRSVRETRVPTVAAYHRSRSRYQVSKLGGRLHREAEEILRAADGAREVARELLARIVESLNQILLQVGNVNRSIDGEALAGAVTGAFNDHQMFTESVTDFYAYLAGVLSRYDLAGEEYAQFKGLLLDYVDLISADVNRNAPEILERLRILLKLIDRVLDNLPAVPVLAGEMIAVDRLPGRTRSDWEQLAVWYGAGNVRSGPDQLRAAARQALGQLITNARRMLAASGTGLSRRADLLKLAAWFHNADSDTAHRLYDAAFGCYPARHLLIGPDEPDVSAGPSTSWWDSAPVDVPVSLRERGDRAARGRSSRVPDPGADAQRLLARARRQSEARHAAAAELVAVGSLDGSRLSRAARDLLLDKLSAVFAAVSMGGMMVEHRDADLGLLLRAISTRGEATVVAGDDGAVTIHDVRLVALPLGAAGRDTGLAVTA